MPGPSRAHRGRRSPRGEGPRGRVSPPPGRRADSTGFFRAFAPTRPGLSVRSRRLGRAFRAFAPTRPGLSVRSRRLDRVFPCVRADSAGQAGQSSESSQARTDVVVLAEQRRRQVRLAGAGVGVVVEAQRRSGQLDRPRASGARRRSAAPATASGPRRRRRRACAPCRPACRRGEPLQPVLGRVGGAAPPRSRRPARRGARPAPGWWRTAVVRRSRAAAANALPLPLGCRTRSGPARRRCGTGRTARSTGGGCPARAAPRAPTVQRVPWKACTPTTPASSEVRTTRPRPVRSPLVQRGERRRTRRSSRPAGRRSARRPWSAARCPVTDISRPRPGRSGRSRRGRPRGRRGRSR